MLNQWLLSLFNADRFERLAEHLKSEALEGLDENNVHRFHLAPTGELFNLTELPTEQLPEYDQNIVRHTLRLNERRLPVATNRSSGSTFSTWRDLHGSLPGPLLPRSGQTAQSPKRAGCCLQRRQARGRSDRSVGRGSRILAATEQAGLLDGDRQRQNVSDARQHPAISVLLGEARAVTRATPYLLLTPNEGLSQQHLGEFEAAGIDAELFNKDGRGLFTGRSVEIIEVTRLREEMGDRAVAIEAFEGNNPVLVDEGHRGASGGEDGAWLKARNALCEKGFSFEYSATFQQAVAGNAKLTDLYAKGILFNYSYRYFYGDGFGKDYQILNLDEDTQANHLELYLVACLLTFFQQQRLYREQATAFAPFNIEKPLWIFVGGSVTKALTNRDASDIVEILQFLARYVADRVGSIAEIERVLNQGLVTATGRESLCRSICLSQHDRAHAAQIVERRPWPRCSTLRAAGSYMSKTLRGLRARWLRLGGRRKRGIWRDQRG